MAYTKTVWEDYPNENTIIDADKLNNIEDGIEDLDTRLTTAEGEIDTAQTDINNAEAVIGNENDTYSASSTYALGSLVIYGGLLYKCTTAITVAEAWTIGHWTQVSLLDITKTGSEYSTSEKIVGTWIDGKPIYRRILSGTKTSGTALNFPTISNIAEVISLNGILKSDSGMNYYHIPSYNESNIYTTLECSSSGVVKVNASASGYSNGLVIIFIEYTKTTD